MGSALPNRASVISPSIDFFCVGGLSLIVLIPLLLSGRERLDFVAVGPLIWAQALINYTHFMASYRIVYRDRQMIRQHPWATIWVPLILLVFVGVALATSEQSKVMLVVFFAVSSAYLAWHYTGQVWGMMASHAYLGGVKFEKTERFLLRTSLRILLVWHVMWFLHVALSNPLAVELPYRVISATTGIAFVLGLIGLVMIRRRAKRFPPARAIIAWVAIFVWYLSMARWGLAGLFLVQLFHAIQYLEFPVRVEVNRATGRRAGRVAGHVALYAAVLVLTSVVVILIVPGPAMSVAASFLGVPPTTVAPVLVLYFINIHHYFTDGVIWKISNPEVRKELFAHVPSSDIGGMRAPTSAPAGQRRSGRESATKTAW